MSDTKHSPEPWKWVDSDIIWQNGAVVSSGVGEMFDCAEWDARRIVACVNACAGLSTKALEKGYLTNVVDWAAEQCRDDPGWPTELHTALRRLGKLPDD